MSLPKKKKKPRKGFTRSRKQWEESVAGHIGKLVDKTSIKDIAELAIMGTVGYYGYKAFGLPGIPIGLIGYKLATTMGGTPPIAQISGLATLSAIGLANIPTMSLQEHVYELEEKLKAKFSPQFRECVQGYQDKGLPMVAAMATCTSDCVQRRRKEGEAQGLSGVLLDTWALAICRIEAGGIEG